ncbi:MAG: glyoxylate/hydroxypyruvate reductase A [Pseudomonadota bacterium]
MTKILWAGADKTTDKFLPPLRTALRTVLPNAQLIVGKHQPKEIEYLVYAPNGPVQDFKEYTSLKLIQSIWAGVDVILSNPDFPKIPLARMADTGMAEGMSDYILGQVLRHHLSTDRFTAMQPGQWFNTETPILARNRKVAILGLGNLGQFCGKRIATQGFKVLGWSRSQKTINGIDCYAGQDGFNAILSEADIFVLLLPNTTDTENTINRDAIARMKKGASIINAGRGEAIDDKALIDALETGHLSQATLDVFRTEPLPKDHPFWSTPNLLITPHVAAETRFETACDFTAENIRRGETGEPFLALVDRNLGY